MKNEPNENYVRTSNSALEKRLNLTDIIMANLKSKTLASPRENFEKLEENEARPTLLLKQ